MYFTRQFVVLTLSIPVVAQQWETVIGGFSTPFMARDPVRGRIVNSYGNEQVVVNGPEFAHRHSLGIHSHDAPMVWDPIRREILAVVGTDLVASNGFAARTIHAPPGANLQHLAFDEARSAMIALGFESGGITTFRYDGTTLTRLQTAHRPPAGLFGSTDPVVYDGTRQRVTVMTTNTGVNQPLAMWSFDGTDWSAVTAGTPPFRNNAVAGFDPARQRLVYHGGLASIVQAPLDDVWEWDGTTWTLATAHTGIRGANSTYFDPVLGRFYFTSGVLLLWDGVVMTPQPTPPLAWPGPNVTALVPTSPTGSVIAVTPQDTWEWSFSRWHLRDSVQQGLEGAFRDASGNVFGVSTHTQPGTWLWLGSSWLPLPTGLQPPPRRDFGLAYDSVRNRAVLFGGLDDAGVTLNDTWEWSAGWQPMAPATSPPARTEPAMAFDPVAARTVLFGGKPTVNDFFTTNDSWFWNGTNWTAAGPLPTTINFEAYGLRFDAVTGRPQALLFDENGSSEYVHNGTAWQLAGPPVASSPYFVFGQRVLIADDPAGTVTTAIVGGALLAQRSTLAATDAVTGTSCGGGLLIAARTAPHVGEPEFGIDLLGSPGAMLLGLSGAAATVPLGGGCEMQIQTIALAYAAFTNASGFAEVLLPIPELPALLGVSVFGQAAQLDPTSPIGVAVSKRLELRLGL